MEYLRQTAMASVGRACGFAGLAIGCVMIGLSFDPPQMMRAGAILTLLLAIGLCIKAWIASKQDYRGTETWLMLPREHKPPAAIAQKALSSILRETYFRFARLAAGLSASLWLVAVALPLMN
jgi:hypothetical protein